MPAVTRTRFQASSIEPLLAALWLSAPLGEILRAAPDNLDSPPPHDAPATTLIDGNQLALLRKLYRDGHPKISRFVSMLLSDAEAILEDAESKPDTEVGSAEGEGNGAEVAEATVENRGAHFLADNTLSETSENIVILALAAYLSSDARFSGKAGTVLRGLLSDEDIWRGEGSGLSLHRSDLMAGRWADALRHLAAVTEAVRLLEVGNHIGDEQRAALRRWFGDLIVWLDGVRFEGRATNAASARSFDLQREIIDGFACSPLEEECVEGDNEAGWTNALVGAAQVRSPSHASGRSSMMGLLLDASFRIRSLENERYGGAPEAVRIELNEAQARAAELASENQQLLRYASDLRRRYTALLSSRAWMLTAPLRETGRLIKSALTGRAIPRTSVPAEIMLKSRNADALAPSNYRRNNVGRPRLKFGLSSRVGLFHASPADHLARLQAFTPENEDALKAAYHATPISAAPDTFVLYRIIGNDLVPRHRKGQSRENVRFVLENEPALEGCEKRWIINRILDADEEREITELLIANKQAFTTLPFDIETYRGIGWDEDGPLSPDHMASRSFLAMREDVRERARASRYRLKNNYAMNNNGARNAALDDGRGRAKWILPWDGNCFITAKAWASIREGVLAQPYLKYFAVPMERMTDNARLLADDFNPQPVEEPQLIFRSDAAENFNEEVPYGRRPKVELFWRLGIPGPWDTWADDPWDLKRPSRSPEARQFGVAGWVARMFSGSETMEQPDVESRRSRTLARQDAVIATLDMLDERLRGGP